MSWLEELTKLLAKNPIGGYADDPTPASEPTAMAAMALVAAGEMSAAEQAMDYLAGAQQADGSVGVRANEPAPGWPTSLAILSWKSHPQADTRYQAQIDAAIAWTIKAQGKPIPRESATAMGHDTTLVGWSWAADTHSWIEPTVLHVLSLKACGQSDHPRVREAIRLLMDRQLPGGGCNYGNTVVLGQTLRPHLQPSGMLLLALADEQDPSGRMEKSIQYLTQAVNETTTAASLSWALLGLAAVGKNPADAPAWLEHCYRRLHRTKSLYRLALLAHAAFAQKSPLVHHSATEIAG